MTDGLLDQEEWADASRLSLSDSVELRLKEYRGHVFIGLVFRGLGRPFVANLFVQPGDRKIHQLHASAQIGERILSPGEGDDPPFVWGYSPGWYANEVRWVNAKTQSLTESGADPDEAQRESLFPYDGFEFELLRSRFEGSEWLLRVDVLAYPDYHTPIVFPAGTTRKNTEGWFRLMFSE
ncbi:hypothetical protein ACFL3S_09415 [Gemmatimonadota bacterium]